MDKTLRFWVDCSLKKRHENANRTKPELTAEILREYEVHGDRCVPHRRGQSTGKQPIAAAKTGDADARSRTIWRTLP